MKIEKKVQNWGSGGAVEWREVSISKYVEDRLEGWDTSILGELEILENSVGLNKKIVAFMAEKMVRGGLMTMNELNEHLGSYHEDDFKIDGKNLRGC